MQRRDRLARPQGSAAPIRRGVATRKKHAFFGGGEAGATPGWPRTAGSHGRGSRAESSHERARVQSGASACHQAVVLTCARYCGSACRSVSSSSASIESSISAHSGSISRTSASIAIFAGKSFRKSVSRRVPVPASLTKPRPRHAVAPMMRTSTRHGIASHGTHSAPFAAVALRARCFGRLTPPWSARGGWRRRSGSRPAATRDTVSGRIERVHSQTYVLSPFDATVTLRWHDAPAASSELSA